VLVKEDVLLAARLLEEYAAPLRPDDGSCIKRYPQRNDVAQ
jgi:hypothetical protein